MKKAEAIVTYLEMHERPKHKNFKFQAHYEVKLCQPITYDFYIFLYKSAGQDWTWTERVLLSKEQLLSEINHPNVEIHVLYEHGCPAGYIEFIRNSGEVEINYFGIFPQYYGRKLGRDLLNWAVEYVWSFETTKRFWLHTCDFDHPAALKTYQNAGFVQYKTGIEIITLLDSDSSDKPEASE
jgi:GNAT superfamily N-acetyltransferase